MKIQHLHFRDKGPDIQRAIGPLDQWLEQARAEHATLQLAVQAMRRTELQTDDAVRQADPGDVIEFNRTLSRQRTRYQNLSLILDAVMVRNSASLVSRAIRFGVGA